MTLYEAASYSVIFLHLSYICYIGMKEYFYISLHILYEDCVPVKNCAFLSTEYAINSLYIHITSYITPGAMKLSHIFVRICQRSTQSRSQCSLARSCTILSYLLDFSQRGAYKSSSERSFIQRTALFRP